MADSALDDIIKQKRMKRFNISGNSQQIKKKQNQPQQKWTQGRTINKGRLFKEVQMDLGIKTKRPVSINTDARNKIIQKQRFKYADARDRLAQIAKQGDAREKLNKIRKGKPGEKVVPLQKKTVIKKKIVNVPRLNTLKNIQTQKKGAAVIRTVPGAGVNRPQKKVFVQGNRGVVQHDAGVVRKRVHPGRSYPIANNPSVLTIKNNYVEPFEDAYEVVDYGQNGQAVSHSGSFRGMGVPTAMENILSTRSRPQVVYEREYEPEVRPSRLRITAANTDYRIPSQQYDTQWSGRWENQGRMPAQKREYFEDESSGYQQVYPKKVATSAPVQQVAKVNHGTKVVVSNLHPCVNIEDMEELFGTIGQVSSVRMVRQGVAEAIFINQDDAYRSVDLFNNRQLDGQPMKVMVIRKKGHLMSTPTPSTTSQSRSVLRNARGNSGYYM